MAHDHATDHGHGHDDHDHDHGGTGLYMMVFLALCVLTGASFFTCSKYWPFKDTPAIGMAFMMAVSCTKAMLVILFFMHLKWEANWKYVLTIPCAMMSLYLVLMLVPDVGLRQRKYAEERQVFAAEPAEHHAVHAAGAEGHGGDHAAGHGAAEHSEHSESSGH